MRNAMICSMILLALALSCGADAQLVLSGADGLAIWDQIANPEPPANASTNAGLWDWGEIPLGYTLNQTGKLMPIEDELTNDFGGWSPSI